MRVLLKLLTILIISSNSNLLLAKPDECHTPKPKDSRVSYNNFVYDKKVWDQNSFLDSSYKLINIKNLNFTYTHEVPIISILMFKNTRWTETEVLKRIDNAAFVLNQCGVRINNAHLIKAIAPNKTAIIRRHRACYNSEPNGQYFITKTVPYLPGIRIFLIEKFIIGPEAYAAPEYSSKNTPDQNTIWMRPLEKRRIQPLDPNFQVLAHELGHILLNSGHIWDDELNTPNLMSGKPSLLNNVLTAKQCEIIRNNRLVNKVN